MTVTRKLPRPTEAAEARRDVLDLLAWDPVVIDQGALEGAWEAQDRAGLAFRDALIVAAARSAGCEALLTQDLRDGQDLGGVAVVDPFAREPSSLSA